MEGYIGLHKFAVLSQEFINFFVSHSINHLLEGLDLAHLHYERLDFFEESHDFLVRNLAEMDQKLDQNEFIRISLLQMN